MKTGPLVDAKEMPLGTKPAQKFWERYFAVYDTLNESIPYRRMIERHVELLNPGAGDFALDAGTGTGNVALALLRRGVRILGVDFCQPALEICRRKVPGGEFLYADLSKPLEFLSNCFDSVACCCVLHVLDERSQRCAVRELFRVLKPGGSIVISSFVSGFDPLRVYWETLRERRKISKLGETLWFGLSHGWATLRIFYYVAQIQRGNKHGEHNFLRQDVLAAMLEQSGFLVKSVEPIFASQCVLALARKPADQSFSLQ